RLASWRSIAQRYQPRFLRRLFVYGRLGKQRLFASVYPDFCQRAQPHHVGVGGCAIGDVQH
ncbi:phosphotransferase system, EIIC family protein, partial [Vibrio parahaemolyticus V-223/04]